MVFLHPVLLATSFLGALFYSLQLNGVRGLRFALLYLLPMMVIAGLVNPLFNHRGMTILGYLNDNPITLESILYGIAIGVMFGSVILWFSCFHTVITSDKILYLFGRAIPSLSLLLSMVFRFVPKFKAEIQVISRGQKSIGRDVSDGRPMERVRNGIKILSIMVTWALENAIDTADSMKARGYGLPGRTNYSIYRFDGRDKGALLALSLLIAILLVGAFLSETTIQYFPTIQIKEPTQQTLLFEGAYFLLCFVPIIRNRWEEIKWQHLRSKI